MARWMPCVLEESSEGKRELSLMTKHFTNRRVFLQGEINAESVNDLVIQLLYLEKESQEPIYLYINSGGGEVNAGLLLYDVIQGMKAPIYMYCTGMAASMAAVILAGGQKGRRFILPHSKTMIHEPLIGGGVGGSATSIRNISENILKTKAILNGILAKHTGKTLEEIDEATSSDHYMDAEESLAFGICDAIKTTIE